MGRKHKVSERLLRRLLRRATEELQNVAWPTRVALLQLRAVAQNGGSVAGILRRIAEVDEALMEVAGDLERGLRGISPQRRQPATGQLRLAM